MSEEPATGIFKIINFDALKKTVYMGKEYKKVKTFKGKGAVKRAEKFAESLEGKTKSRRFPPVVEKVRIGWRFGCMYRVLIPKDVTV